MLVTEAAVPGVRPLRSGSIYSEIDGPVNTGLAIANPNNVPASISFFFTDASGYSFGQGETTIAPNAQLAKFLNEPPFRGGSNMKGTFTFTSSVPIAVVALRGFTNERSEFLITTLPVTDLSATFPATSALFPHFADGAGWTTQIVLINPSTPNPYGNSSIFQSRYIRFGCIACSSDRKWTDRINLCVFDTTAKLVSTADFWCSQKTETGSVRISPDSGVASPSGVLIFSYSNRGVTVTEAGVPLVGSGSAFRMYGESSGQRKPGRLDPNGICHCQSRLGGNGGERGIDVAFRRNSDDLLR